VHNYLLTCIVDAVPTATSEDDGLSGWISRLFGQTFGPEEPDEDGPQDERAPVDEADGSTQNEPAALDRLVVPPPPEQTLQLSVAEVKRRLSAGYELTGDTAPLTPLRLEDLDLPDVPPDLLESVPPTDEGPSWLIILQTVGPASTRIEVNLLHPLIVGRSDPTGAEPDLDLALYGSAAAGVSRHHAMLIPRKLGPSITDMESTNGTWVNGRYVAAGIQQDLKEGDRIELGLLKLIVRTVTPLDRPPE
jgi:hypothetical protein